MRAMLSTATSGCAFGGARAQERFIVASYDCGDASARLELRHPSDVGGAGEEVGRTTQFVVSSSEPLPEDLARSVLDSIRAHESSFRWSSMTRPPTEKRAPRAIDRSPYATYTLMALVLAFFAIRVCSIARSLWRSAVLRREAAWVAVVLASFVAIALTVPEQVPTHEHNSFVARSDCAVTWDCDTSIVGWGEPTYHVYGVILRALTYRLPTLAAVSLSMTVLALLLMYGFVRAIGVRYLGHRRGRCMALVALALAALHPVAIRLAVGGTFWPYAAACVFGAGLCASTALRPRAGTAQATRALHALAATAFFILALRSSVVLYALAPLFLLVPIAWGRLSRAGWRFFSMWAVGGALVLAYCAADVLSHFEQYGAAAEGTVQLGRAGTNTLYDLAFITPPVLGLLAAVGIYVAARRWRLGVAPLYLLVSTELVLGSIHVPYDSWPSRLIHGSLSLYVFAIFAALGVDACLHWVRAQPRLRRAAPWVLAAAVALTVPMSRDGLAYLTEPSILGTELSELSRAFDELPDHDLLVIPPFFVEPSADLHQRGAPTEVRFPIGEWRAVHAARGQSPAAVMELPQFLERGPGRSTDVLFYAGSLLYTFNYAEIWGRRVPSPPSRPILDQLRSRYELRPVHTFRLSTKNHRWSPYRLAADQVPDVELGFYRLTER